MLSLGAVIIEELRGFRSRHETRRMTVEVREKVEAEIVDDLLIDAKVNNKMHQPRNEYWNIRLSHKSGTPKDLLCTEEIGRTAIEEFISAKKQVDGTGTTMLCIHGLCDTADRAPCDMYYEVAEYDSISLMRM